MGFVNKSKEKSLLKKKQRGTFLLRFSESVIGGITFSWVEIDLAGNPDIKTVQPFTRVDLSQIPFHEIIRNFQILEAENVPENPLLYLYPNIPKDEAFGKFYTDKTGDDSPYIKYIKTKLMFVSKESTLEARSLMSSDMEQVAGLEPHTGLYEEVADQVNFAEPLLPTLETYSQDPMLISSPEPQNDELLQYLNNPSNFNDDFLQTDPGLPELNFPTFNSMPIQACGSIYH